MRALLALRCLVIGHWWTVEVTEEETPYSNAFLLHAEVVRWRVCTYCGTRKRIGLRRM